MNYFDNIFDNLKISGNVNGLTNELKCLYLYNLYKKYNKNILFVSNTLFEANMYYQSISNYEKNVLLFPMDDFITSEALAISPELKITRLETLNSLLQTDKKIIVTNLMGFLRYLPTKNYYQNIILKLKKGDSINFDELKEKISVLGYNRESIVNKTGEVAIRGYIIDIFPISSSNPVRIEFWGDEIESIREFNIDSQCTLKNIDEVVISPNSEMLVDKDIRYREMKDYIDVTNIGGFIDDYILVIDNYDTLYPAYKKLVEEITEYSIGIGINAKTKYMFDFNECLTKKILYLNNFDDVKNDSISYNTGSIEYFPKNMLEINKLLKRYLKNKKTVIICLENRYQINKIIDELDNNFIITNEFEIYPNMINLIVKKIKRGFQINDKVIISASEFFNKVSNEYKYKTNFKIGTKIKDITKLNIGDYVVHSINGIGKYLGIKTLNKNGLMKDYIMIEYFGGDKLYVPVEKIDWVNKYSSSNGGAPHLTKLGSLEWEKTKKRVREKIESIAKDLIKLYAERESSVGIRFDKDTSEQALFESNFLYEETSDQMKVIKEIKKDMEKPQPMDRLLCGDVGYGKTEVAFRAMFKAVSSGYQAAMLCPTTLLSQQHYENAIKRFESFPVNVALLNRFVSTKRKNEIITGLKEGTIDIVIGTHKLLGKDIEYKKLGFLVIDEEQRFGVKHKEKIKQYKNNIDVLTLSATPIPRTLQMSMSGVRSLSLIETPPINRYPIQTYVLAQNNQVVKDAIYKELSRGGQVYILYNNVEDMMLKKYELEKLIPDITIGIAHGRMNKNEIEKVMNSFHNNEYQVLLCTTIIETGIDIPSVNTIIIMDADRFGLSQLYQIRGRVGRSNKIAYCYLMYQPGKVLSEVATKRLQAIKDFTELGSGFAIAMRDLSIRGAGDILGSEQSGFVDTVGVELFMSMLDEEVSKLKGIKPKVSEEKNTQPLVEVSTTIDDNMAMEEDLKIEIHKKINTIDSLEKLNAIKDELTDRFGKLDENIIIYMYEEWFEKLASDLEIKNIKQTKNSIEIMLPPILTSKIRGDILFKDVTKLSRMFRFRMKGSCLIITLDIIKLDKHFIYYLIELFEIIKNNIVENNG
ncbi:MAG: transcription-repair coupling factor [Bacilli bacterium]|nr:transcription-repair coupling factor [Bacilli bacterium]